MCIGEYPQIEPYCRTIDWTEANMDNNWGNCMEMIIDDQYRWITTNSVPDYYFNPYCPIGRGYGYCVEQEVGKFDDKCCFFYHISLR